jgi:hypothetical protein
VISVICVYNDKATLDSLLVASLQRQDSPCDLVCIDNTAGQHTCAATVLNEAGCAAANDIVMFVHQDVELLSPTWLSDAERLLRGLGVGAAAGVAGVDGDGAAWSSVWHGEPRQFSGGTIARHPAAVQTLDGCLLLVMRVDFQHTRFDADACRGWHLFVAEYCLSRQQRGFGSFVLPLPVYHRSLGPADARVISGTAKAIVKKHRRRTPRIFTTVGELTSAPMPQGWRARLRWVLRRLGPTS